MALSEVYPQETFTGSLSKISPDKFQSLLDILTDNVLSELNETAKSVLDAIDKSKIVNSDKPGTMPSDVINLFKRFSLDGRFSVGCYMVMKQWYESFGNGDGPAEPAKKEAPKKATQKKTKEVEEKIKEVKAPEPEEAEETSEEEPQDTDTGEYDDDEQEPPFDEVEEVIEESVDEGETEELQPQPEAEIVEEPKEEKQEKKEQAPPKEKKKSTPKKKKSSAQKVNAELLSIDPKNIEIYDITPETHPQMFLEFEGEFISKRVTENKSWRPNHPAFNPISNELLKEIIDVFANRWVTYADVMKMVDHMTCAYTSYTAKRIWWMVKYNEFIRYSLVKETRGYGEEAYRLVQRWVSHPMVSFALDEWKKANKTK